MTPNQFEQNQLIPGWFSKFDIAVLSIISTPIKNGTIIELGSLHGRSAFCLSVSSPTSKIYCLDYWSGWTCKTIDDIERPNTLETFNSYMSEYKNVTPVQLATDVPIIPIWTEPVDMVFIDTSHVNPDDWDCIQFWLPKIKSGGILCGHDYYTVDRDATMHYPDVNANVERLEAQLGKPVTLYKSSSIWSFIV